MMKCIKWTLFVTLITVVCLQSKAVLPQEKKSIDQYLKYAVHLTNYPDSVITKTICLMSFFDEQNGKDSIESMLNNRRIVLNSEINDTIANIVTSLLLYYDSLNDSDIQFLINSPGGSVTAGLAIYDTMTFTKSDIQTVCTRMAASMAAVLLMSGKEGKRKAHPQSIILIHNPKSEETEKDSKKLIAEYEIQKYKKELCTIISEKCHQPFEKVWLDCDQEFWMTAYEAKVYGVIDEVLTK